jgi:hypothetical protein
MIWFLNMAQVIPKTADNLNRDFVQTGVTMTIGSVSGIENMMIQSATSMKGNQVEMELQVAIIKQTLDQQNNAGEALVKMIWQGLGQNIDIQA